MLLAGCAVGPNYKQPAPPQAKGYTPEMPAATSSTTNVPGGEPQRFVEGMDISGEWWQLFHSKPLNDLIERSLTNSPGIKSAQAALTAARESMVAQRGAYYPSASAGFAASRNKTSAQVSPNTASGDLTYNLFTPDLTVSYSPDVFGLNRRTVESAKAQEQQARFQLIATHITLSANIAVAAIQEASLRAQVEATRELVASSSNMVDILHRQFDKGYASRLDLATQEAQLAQLAATLPPLVKQLAVQHDLLAALAGDFPDKATPTFELSSLKLPEELPLTLPSRLVEQRPDVRQAAENLHFASAQVGIAVANRLPNFMLTADVGTMATEARDMFTSGAGFWALGASVTQPIFAGGTLLHKERAQRALLVEAAEQYRGAVLTACQNVADTLNALEQDANALKAAAAAGDAAKVSLDVSRQQWKAGYANYLSLLTAEQAYQQAVVNLVQAQANRYSDTAALFQALGGGWWNRTDLASTKK